MNIKICENILKLRKEKGMTQAQVAEFLCVSPQAVSKWEQDAAIPDVYLIPKIAFLFDVSLDYLFGVSDMNTADQLVIKYIVSKNEKHYKEAKDVIDCLLEIEPTSFKCLSLLCELEFERALEYLEKSKEACQKLGIAADGIDKNWLKRAKIQLMRFDSMNGDYEFLEHYINQFELTKDAIDFNYLLIALSNANQNEKIINIGNEYIDTFTYNEKISIYPNLLDAALKIGNFEYGEKYFQEIVLNNIDVEQVFNAWWLLWMLYNKKSKVTEAENCRQELLKLLPEQKCNEFRKEFLESCLMGSSKKSNPVL